MWSNVKYVIYSAYLWFILFIFFRYKKLFLLYWFNGSAVNGTSSSNTWFLLFVTRSKIKHCKLNKLSFIKWLYLSKPQDKFQNFNILSLSIFLLIAYFYTITNNFLPLIIKRKININPRIFIFSLYYTEKKWQFLQVSN